MQEVAGYFCPPSAKRGESGSKRMCLAVALISALMSSFYIQLITIIFSIKAMQKSSQVLMNNVPNPLRPPDNCSLKLKPCH
jgi:hypothetical protein